MNCVVNIRDVFLPSSTGGGSWELVGYSLSPSGPFDINSGSWPWLSNNSDNPSVDFGPIDQGYYKLNYFVSGPCGGNQEIVIPVVGGGDAGITKALTVCQSNGIINIASELGSTFDQGVLEASFIFSGSGVSSAGYIQQNTTTPLDDQFDPSQVALGTYIVQLDIIPQTPSGYSLNQCCDPTTAILQITVVEESVTIGIDAACNIYIVDQVGCSSGTFELFESTDGFTFNNIGVQSLPYQVTADNYYMWQSLNCDCGLVQSNIVQAVDCCTASGGYFITLESNVSFCQVRVDTGFLCSGAVYKWYKSCDNGNTWTYLSGFDGQNAIGTNDTCLYQCIAECPTQANCKIFSNIIPGVCEGSCTNPLGLGTQTGCTYQVNSGLYCNGGILKLIKVGVGVVDQITLDGTNNYPFIFNIPSDGDYYASLECNDGCPDYTGGIQTYTGCNASCASSVTVSMSSCLITATVTNCPNPIYVFKDPTGTVRYTGSNNTFTADQDGTWTVEVSGCPNCPTLIDTATASGCTGTSCNCSASITESNCAEFSLNLVNCSGYAIQWQFSDNGGSTWSNVGNGSLTYDGTQNGDYRAVLSKSGCTDVLTNVITVSCFTASCLCSLTVGVDNNTCELTHTITDCVGYTLQWQVLNGSWQNTGPQNPPSPFTPLSDGVHRLVATKAGCNTVYSDFVSVSCVEGCQISIDSLSIDSSDCAKLLMSYSGGQSNNVQITVEQATINPTNCSTASGWSQVSTTGTFTKNNNGTGSGELILPSNICDVCIRVTVDNSADGCGIAQEKIFVPCCCNDTPSINQSTNNNTYSIKVFDNLGNENATDPVHVDNSDIVSVSGVYKVYKNGIEINSVTYNQPGQAFLSYNKNSSGSPRLTTGSIIKEVYAARNTAGSPTQVVIPCAPNTATLSGSAGTVTQADLTLDLNNKSVFENALKVVIENYLIAQGYEYSEITVSVSLGGLFTYGMRSRHNPSVNFVGTRLNFSSSTPMTGAVHVTGGVEYEVKGLATGTQRLKVELSGINTPCGNIAYVKESEAFQFSPASDFNFHVMINEDTIDLVSGVGGTSSTCSETTLTVSNECVGATYLWTTSETTNSIEVTAGSYGVDITCPDGCIYTLNVTV